MDGTRIIGLVTVADLRKISQGDWSTISVDSVMTPVRELPEISPGSRLLTAIERFAGGDLPALPVVDDGRLVGMLERDAVLSYVRMREMLGMHRRK